MHWSRFFKVLLGSLNKPEDLLLSEEHTHFSDIDRFRDWPAESGNKLAALFYDRKIDSWRHNLDLTITSTLRCPPAESFYNVVKHALQNKRLVRRT